MKGPVSKTGVPARVPWVQIPPPPLPRYFRLTQSQFDGPEMFSFWHLFSLVGDTLSWISVFWPISMVLFIPAFAFCSHYAQRGLLSTAGLVTIWVLPVLIPVSILTIGVAYAAPDPATPLHSSHPEDPWFDRPTLARPQFWINLVLSINIPMGIALIWRNPGVWPATVATCFWWGWVSLLAAMMARMSVTGVWL